ncbi:MAG TPA: hypothetical protein CFH84_06420, partial [Sulfurimonas sp. UBA12504]
MHTIKLQVQDTIYSHIMFFFKSLNSKELRIIEDKEIKKDEETKELQALSNHSANLIDEWKDDCSMEIKQSDVLLCEFYFSDLQKSKNRPVLIFKDNLPHNDFMPYQSVQKMHQTG